MGSKQQQQWVSVQNMTWIWNMNRIFLLTNSSSSRLEYALECAHFIMLFLNECLELILAVAICMFSSLPFGMGYHGKSGHSLCSIEKCRFAIWSFNSWLLQFLEVLCEFYDNIANICHLLRHTILTLSSFGDVYSHKQNFKMLKYR